MAWNRAYHSHTLPGQKREPTVVDAASALSISSDANDYEENDQHKSACPVVPENWPPSGSPRFIQHGSELDYVNAVAVIANQCSLSRPHPNPHRCATFSGVPSYINMDSSGDHSWPRGFSLHREAELENETTFNSAPGNDSLSMQQALPTTTTSATAAELVPHVLEKSHSYQNLPISCPPSGLFHGADSERRETVLENSSRKYQSQTLSRLESLTFHSEFVTSIYRALEEEGRQAKTDLQDEQDGYVRMQSVSLKPPAAKEVVEINMDSETEEEERSYYNIIQLPKS